MHTINLLPWRHQQRKKQMWRRQTMIAMSVSIVITAIIFSKNYFKKSLIHMSGDISNLHYVGYLADQHRQWGLVVLSDGTVQFVTAQTFFADNIYVKTISANQLQIETADHQLHTLVMQTEALS